MNLIPSTYPPAIDSLCKYCGADFSQADTTSDADPKVFVQRVNKMAVLLNAWSLTSQSAEMVMAYITQFTQLALDITRATPTLVERLRNDFFVDSARAIRGLRKVGKKLRNDYSPQQLIAIPDCASVETRLSITQILLALPKIFNTIADSIDKVAAAATMPDDPLAPQLEHWTPQFSQLLDTTIRQRTSKLENMVAKAMKAMKLSRQQAVTFIYDSEHAWLEADSWGKKFLDNGIAKLSNFVVELRRFSVNGKGLKSFSLDKLVAHIADFLWAKQALEEISTTVTINHADTVNVNDIHDNNNVKL